MLVRNLVRCLLVAVLASVSFVPGAFAQDSGRRVVGRIEPRYPEIAKKMGIAGIVRIQATVTPSGTVKTVKALGGSALLVDAAAEALKKWKFEKSSEETVETVIFNFKNQNQ